MHATSQTYCHLPGKMSNSAAKYADRARITIDYQQDVFMFDDPKS
jgi:hypothetical protein